jgi:GNAT superfamily N-acetyltransferase
MSLRVRNAEATDASGIAAIVRESFPGAGDEQVARHLSACLAEESHLVLAAVTGDSEIAGYVSVHWLPYLFLPGPEGFVSELFVREGQRGRGAGRMLLAAVKKEAARRGCARLSLLNMRGRPSYERQFYAKDGWTERPEAANFILRFPEVKT